MRDVDKHIELVLEALRKSGQIKDTIIVFTSDHGEMAAAHGLRQKGTIAFKEVVNVPFIIVHPDGPKNKKGTGSGITYGFNTHNAWVHWIISQGAKKTLPTVKWIRSV